MVIRIKHTILLTLLLICLGCSSSQKMANEKSYVWTEYMIHDNGLKSQLEEVFVNSSLDGSVYTVSFSRNNDSLFVIFSVNPLLLDSSIDLIVAGIGLHEYILFNGVRFFIYPPSPKNEMAVTLFKKKFLNGKTLFDRHTTDKYPSISPYAYCAWNPVKLVDPDGKYIWEINSEGKITKHIKDKNKIWIHYKRNQS